MKVLARIVVTLVLIFAFLSSALPCGPGYITPLFDTTTAPETPYTDYASGRLGIVKPAFQRAVLFAAYRYIAGSGMNAAEQQAIIEVWKSEIDNKDFRDDTTDAAVKVWVDKRKGVVGKDEATPAIYAERAYGGYDFFPNCTKNAFETAAETLSDRVSGHGPNDPNVQNWVRGQDQVFQNCSSGKQTPEAAPAGAPDWLQKDRAYQLAAASFYSLDYNDAKRRFAEIAQDTDSPWQETADYLVARTLIRQASLSKTAAKASPFYEEAEKHLEKFTSRTGKFSPSSERLLGLIKYRIHPKERVSELAKKLSFNGANENFRQDLIDYNWLLDKFENEVLTAEEKRKAEAEAKKAEHPANYAGVPQNSDANKVVEPEQKNEGDLELNFYANDRSWRFFVKADAADEDAIAAAEKVYGKPLNDELKQRVREARQYAYVSRFKDNQTSGRGGQYYGEDKITPSLMPDFLRQDALTDWLYTYQTAGPETYLYSLKKFRDGGGDLWLMTALSKAEKSSTDLPRLLEDADKANRRSAAYPTIAFHAARIMLTQGKQADARKLIDEMLNLGDELPISARNSFIGLRLTLAETLEDFLRFSLKKPYGFDFNGDVGSVDDIIAEQKTYYNPEYDKDGQEAYDAEVDARYKEEKLWQSRAMFDDATIEVINQHFPTASLIEVMRSPAFPDYMRERFMIAAWMRAYLLDDFATLLTITPEIAKTRPEFEPLLSKIQAAKTQPAIDNAALYFVLKNPLFSPYLETGMGKTNNEQEQWSSDDWWCEPYDSEYSDESNAEVPKTLPTRPAFLTAAQSKTAQAQRKRLREIGDAPKFLGERVVAWAKRYPADRRVPEALYTMIEANGWTKYGCGNNEELRDEMAALLRKKYPNSEWTAKLIADESGK